MIPNRKPDIELKVYLSSNGKPVSPENIVDMISEGLHNMALELDLADDEDTGAYLELDWTLTHIPEEE